MGSISMKKFEQLLTEKAGKIDIIDVRAKDAFEQRHIQGALSIPLTELEGKMKDLDKEREYYLICYSGSFSKMATNMLKKKGFKAKNVRSGMNGYKGAVI